MFPFPLCLKHMDWVGMWMGGWGGRLQREGEGGGGGRNLRGVSHSAGRHMVYTVDPASTHWQRRVPFQSQAWVEQHISSSSLSPCSFEHKMALQLLTNYSRYILTSFCCQWWLNTTGLNFIRRSVNSALLNKNIFTTTVSSLIMTDVLFRVLAPQNI